MVRTFATATALAAIVGALSISTISTSAQTTVSLTDGNNWCMFLPPASGLNIGEHEDDAISFCVSSSAQSGSKTFPAGLILSAHFVSGSGYVQVTGELNPSVYLNPADQGGQFDSAGAPVGAVCSGYPYFINIIEPANYRYCIRCCNSQTSDPADSKACLFNHSKYGCEYVIGGNYSGPSINSSTISTSFPSSTSLPSASSSLSPSTSLPSSTSPLSSPSQSSSSSATSSTAATSTTESTSSTESSTVSSTVKAVNVERVAASALSAMLVASLFLLF